MKTPKGYTVKEWRFVLNYPRCKGNGSRAAELAGYAANSAGVTASQLLKKPKIKAAIAERMAKINEDIDISAKRTLREVGLLAFANMGDYVEVQQDGTALVDLSKVTADQMAAIAELNTEEYVEGKDAEGRIVRKVKIRLLDKVGSLTLLMRFHKLLTDKLELTGKDGGPLTIETLDDVLGS